MKTIAQAIREAAPEGRLSCARAFELVETLALEPAAVGREATALGIRITHCQLGLFVSSAVGKGPIVKAALETSVEEREAICARLVEGKLPCRAAWEAASRTGRPRLALADAAESLGIRVSLCQLGCFP